MKKYSIFIVLMTALWTLPFYEKSHLQHVIIIDPSGDAKRTGRKIGDNFERGLTLQCAEKIKEMVEAQVSHIKVIITRMPGDVVYDLQNASLANRLNADLYINLSFYHCQETKPTVFLYQFSYGADFASCNQGLTLHTYDEAYRINKTVTDEMVHSMKQFFMQPKYQAQFSIEGVYALPIKPLIGIVVPSITIEAGLKNKELWMQYIEPFAGGIIGVVNG